jgi:hypothetical protein
MRLKIMLGALAVAVLVGGCGGGGGDTSGGTNASTGASGSTSSSSEGTDATTTNASSGEGGSNASSKPLTKKEFIAKGDVACEEIPNEYEAKRQKLLKESPNKGTTEEINLKAAVPPIFTAVESFEELTPPKGEEAEAEAIVDALEAAGKGLEKEPNAPLSGAKSPYAEFQKLTREYGFKFCSQL